MGVENTAKGHCGGLDCPYCKLTKEENVYLNGLLSDLLPEMEARVKGLQELWPGPEVYAHLYRNEKLLRRIKRAIGR